MHFNFYVDYPHIEKNNGEEKFVVLTLPEEERSLYDFVEPMVQRVADEFVARMNNKLSFYAKLQLLQVKAFPTDGDSRGFVASGFGGLEMPYLMVLKLNPKQSRKQCAFVVAHEMAHLMFLNINFNCGVADRANDDSMGVTAVTRYKVSEDLSEWHEYGKCLEELLCDRVADFIVSKLDYDDEQGNYQACYEKRAWKRKLTDVFEHCFDCELMSQEMIDANDLPLKDGEDFPEGTTRTSYLWEQLLNYNGRDIVDGFDEGKHHTVGSYEQWCNELDECFKEYDEAKFQHLLKELGYEDEDDAA